MNLTLPHSVVYTTKGDVPVAVIAKSLIAHEQLIIESMKILECCAPGLQISAVKVRVGELTQQSPLKELFLVSLVVAFQEDLQQEVPDLIQKLTGLDVPDSADTLVTVLVLMTAAFVVDTAIERAGLVRKTKKLAQEYERKRDELAQMSGIRADQIDAVIKDRIDTRAQRTLLDRARDLFLPAQMEPGTAIAVSRGTGISSEAIGEIPMDFDLEIANEPHPYERPGVSIEIHRADRDEKKHGWRAIVRDVSGRKVRMELAPDIEPADLYGKTTIVGDILVEEHVAGDGAIEPKTYHLLRLRQST